MSDTGSNPVVIVGAGPAGLSAALALRAAGLPAVVLDRRQEDTIRPGSRAAYLHGASLRALEQLSPGLGHEIAGQGIMWATKRSYWGGREIYSKTYPPIGQSGLPPFTSLPQVQTEDLMATVCRKLGVQFQWDTEVVSAVTSPDGVRLTDRSGREWTAEYVIAADGSRSAIRSSLGIPLEGPRSPNTFVVVDLDDDPGQPVPIERVFHYKHPGVAGRNVLIVPFAGGWRIDLNLRVTDTPERFTSPEGLRRWIARVMPPSYGNQLRWVSTYKFTQQVAAAFTDKHRRVLLTGEAAHLFAPFGARGMNSSIPDAISAVQAVRRALSAADSGTAADEIGQFESDRRSAAQYNRACASGALEHMLAHRPTAWLRQRGAATLATLGYKAGEWMDSAPYGPKLAARGAARKSY